jgi:hypothetical protein
VGIPLGFYLNALLLLLITVVLAVLEVLGHPLLPRLF